MRPQTRATRPQSRWWATLLSAVSRSPADAFALQWRNVASLPMARAHGPGHPLSILDRILRRPVERRDTDYAAALIEANSAALAAGGAEGHPTATAAVAAASALLSAPFGVATVTGGAGVVTPAPSYMIWSIPSCGAAPWSTP